ncbi:ribosome small subunit-dependent GTPase A [Labilibacter marinus]|uniref:ribosome small subunit-dependent GTPase A n=1 Tax=Labilibacter marinus TaxID=1477105 RepID=UPI00082FDC74|nr:ribosome small subunit-dependent GTPase A [Labilibacter marinus]
MNTHLHTTLYSLGFNTEIEKSLNKTDWQIGRIVAEHRERYIVNNGQRELEGEILGNLRYSASSRLDFPAVGDWVYISSFDDKKALIHQVIPRQNLLKRRAIGKEGELQIIATNIDYAFIVEAVNRDFSINRFERYITICREDNIEPILVLNKTDLITNEELSSLIHQIKERIPEVDLHTISCAHHSGLNSIRESITKGKTYCFLGSSGVGKSTIINTLHQDELMEVGEISESIDRGKHTTSHRQLVVLKDGGIVIDNPGMREVGLADSAHGLNTSFKSIAELSYDCRFSDCTHMHEKGCAVLQALEDGELNEDSYQNYLKLRREKEHYEDSEVQKRRKGKNLAKMIKEVKKRKG